MVCDLWTDISTKKKNCENRTSYKVSGVSSFKLWLRINQIAKDTFSVFGSFEEWSIINILKMISPCCFQAYDVNIRRFMIHKPDDVMSHWSHGRTAMMTSSGGQSSKQKMLVCYYTNWSQYRYCAWIKHIPLPSKQLKHAYYQMLHLVLHLIIFFKILFEWIRTMQSIYLYTKIENLVEVKPVWLCVYTYLFNNIFPPA